MTLRHQLMQESQCPSFTTSEKDPEEFLNLIMQRILRAEPLLKLQTKAQGVQECYCYQIFMEKQQEIIVPNVQQLLEQSFYHSNLKLAEVPSCFIIQMPRFGKEYKMFSKIVPSLELDITDLLIDNPRECIVCGKLASYECPDCFNDDFFSQRRMKQYCALCNQQAHSHYKRQDHKPLPLNIPDSWLRAQGAERIPRETLELFAVLCIETSHYVSFVKYGLEKGSWMFFDSMADRYGSENGYNIPRVSLCPEVATYLASPLKDLISLDPREMRGVSRRLFCDAYMYMYQSKKMALYK
ncbi:ubiquitin carboxyl-terminal hydrolase CYLD-like [Mantella aurantiaca]